MRMTFPNISSFFSLIILSKEISQVSGTFGKKPLVLFGVKEKTIPFVYICINLWFGDPAVETVIDARARLQSPAWIVFIVK